ncbi:BlaI/MecI/CopY family transcriptional regulator [Streptomyces diastatochromogenes]|uniref:CopY family transcriptional regulator n=1 Tax=Streptomyces diastatochromogenes TaxID=42236 RepID=A0A233S9Q3_STRDA|nr:BlaI/MecI/CopY family transcriptional regulator [Streptomyces diastatochromogenes]MCZ0990941.1 BlaI/MecI/CopY family transcriptional regulator [Streptomyces diastatochromogenes]OXY92410.1 CopY family transcriptional regulator [Streptomyces diastatochromogenes]
MPQFGELEAAIMDAVWQAGKPLRVREILDRLGRDPEPAYNTVHTVTEILFRKGWLAKEKDGRAYRYNATKSREEYVAGLMGEAFAAAGDRSATLARFVEAMRPGEAEELHRLLGEAVQRETPQ